jgi:heavy metal sensor kinase
MKSFRFRITCWFAAALFVLAFLVQLAFTIYVVNELRHSEKVDLKLIARSIEHQLVSWKGHPGDIPPEVFTEIDEGVVFADSGGDLSYAVYTQDGELLHRSGDFRDELARLRIDRDTPYRLFWGIRTAEEWHFVMAYNTPDHILLVSDWRHIELLESILLTFGVCSIIVLILAVCFGIVLGGKVMRPLREIADAADKVRRGELNTRIPAADGKNEIALLKTTLNIAFARLEESFNRISQFSYDAAHELKTPLTALRGNLEVCLSRDRDKDEYQQTLAACIDEIAWMNALVDDLLLLARSGDEYRNGMFQAQDLSTIVQDSVQNMDVLAEDKQVELRMSVIPDIHVEGVETFLRRLACNLVNNAIKYSHRGGAVEVELKPEGSQAKLTVRDTGIGIDGEHQEKIFERLYQVDSSRNRGAGLGLALVKWIVNLHHGTIQLESEPGNGSTFTVRLPLLAPGEGTPPGDAG